MSYNNSGKTVFWWILGIILSITFVIGLFWIYPIYNVYAERKAGEARLAEAESSRQIAVLEAQAKADAAAKLAEAEIARAQGVAKSNEIIGSSLKNNESYLRWLWIEGLQTNQMQVIYVPTEAGLPILEAGKAPQR